MCGIVGYVGKKNSIPILINGLKRLEYRGYDSSGVALTTDGGITVIKKQGKVCSLEKALNETPISGTVGIAHTRWATHGPPNDVNAHPHIDNHESIALIHNGIIENYALLKTVLQDRGVIFKTQTDSEVLVQLISTIYHEDGLSFEESVRIALQKVVGAYGIAVICKDDPNKIVAARYGSPLVIGLGKNEYYLGSDASPIVEHTRNVIYMDEGEMAILTPDGYSIKQIYNNSVVKKDISQITWSMDQIEKGNYPHFMLKEIHEQEHTILDTMRGRLIIEKGTAKLGGIEDYLPRIKRARRFYFTACGTSWHAALIGKYLLEEYAQIPVHVEYASEFRYRQTVVDSETVVIAISQSGETADTLAAIKKAKNAGALTLGICNVVGSSIARETDCGVYTHAGPEIGVASTKAFTAQVSVLSMFSLLLGRSKGLSKQQGRKIAISLSGIGVALKQILGDTTMIEKIAQETLHANNYLYLGRGLNFPVALEGALKLKEISYIHAEGYPAAEMKHGPIALIDDKMPVVVIAPHDKTFEKILSNIEVVKSRSGILIVLTDKVVPELKNIADYIIEVPTTHRDVFPMVASIPLQLLAYHLAVLRGCNVDQPRNLAKSVTVE